VYRSIEGDSKNTVNLGIGGADALLRTILGMDKSCIRIGLSGGDTLRAVVEGFFHLLAMNPGLVEKLSKTALEIYPLALRDNIDLDNHYPHSIVSKFLSMAQERHEGKMKVKPQYLLQLPENFYGNENVKDYDKAFFRNFIERLKQCDIYLIGIGVPKDIKDIYNKITSCSMREEDFVAESNDIPFMRNGAQDKIMAEKAVGLNIDYFREVRRSRDKHIIAVAGGCKKEAIEYAIWNEQGPHFNILVTDKEIANHLINRSKIKPSE
jgi:DNA-binding transcriptional regulator LsrR (DeoR family)